TLYWNDGLTIGTPAKIRDGARTAREHGLSGYITSCEPFSCIDGPPGSNKPRQKPFHMEWLRDGEMPLNELPVRVNRIAYREWTHRPALPDQMFQEILGRALFGTDASSEKIQDVLFVEECWFNEADWFTAPWLHRPADLKRRAARESWPAVKTEKYAMQVEKLRAVAKRYENSSNAAERELHHIASWIVRNWEDMK